MTLVPLALLIALTQTGPTVGTLARQAQKDFTSGRYSEARQKLQQALKLTPQNPSLWRNLGLTDSKLDDLVAATAAYEKALALTPDDVSTCFALGVLYMRQEKAAQAAEVYGRGLALSPDDQQANQNYAALLMQQGHYREAAVPLLRLAQLAPADVSVRASLIESYFKSGMKNEGENTLRDLLASSIASSRELLDLASLLAEDHELQEAQAVLEQVVSLSPESAEAHARLGRLLSAANHYQEATRELGRAVQLAPDSAPYSMGLVETLLLWEHYSTALEFLAAVRNRFQQLPEYHYKVGLANCGLYHFPQGIAELEALAREDPTMHRVQSSLGNCYFASGDLTKAEPYYRKAIELAPREASYYSGLARLLRKQSASQVDEAARLLEKSLELDPNDPQAKLELALCYENQGRYSESQGLLESVIGARPNLLPAHVTLARLYYKQKHKEEGDRERGVVARLEAEEQARQERSHLAPSHASN
jgi:cytochrome c-type biogenesis protein CcmH/NrfG